MTEHRYFDNRPVEYWHRVFAHSFWHSPQTYKFGDRFYRVRSGFIPFIKTSAFYALHDMNAFVFWPADKPEQAKIGESQYGEFVKEGREWKAVAQFVAMEPFGENFLRPYADRETELLEFYLANKTGENHD